MTTSFRPELPGRRPARRTALLVLLLPFTTAVCDGGRDRGDDVRTAEAAEQARRGDTVAAVPAAPPIPAADTVTRRVGAALTPPPDSAERDSLRTASTAAGTNRSGEDPLYARRMGWPVRGPVPLPGALLPAHRIVAFYGNTHSTQMGVLGEYPKEEMLGKLRDEVKAWNAADPSHPVVPALHLIVSVAQGAPGSTGMYRAIMWDSSVTKVHEWARGMNGVFFIDIQTGHSSIQDMLPKFEHFLQEPDVHLAVDPEFMLVYKRAVPSTRVGNMKVSDINWVTEQVARIVREHHLPPKVVVIHRFREDMITGDTKDIILRPEVQLVMDMDGWGAAWLKRDSYQASIVKHPVEFAGFKLFYHNDRRGGTSLMTPKDVLRLMPAPLYIQYQ